VNATDKATLKVIAKTGFTFLGDSHFATFNQALRCLNRLERAGLLAKDGNEYKLTPDGKDAVTYGEAR
jgi:hypothetical protein